jgi:hypothetical protein
MTAALADLWPIGTLLLVGFLPNEVWRWLGLVLSHGIDEGAEILVWVRAVATAVLAGVIARIMLIPPGALAALPVSVRLAAIGLGFAGFLLIRRSVFAGVIVGEVVLVAAMMLFGH